jgi:hypothetical protein
MPATRMLTRRLFTAAVTLTASLGLGLATVADTASTADAAVHKATRVTQHNLLRGHDFTDHGFAKADVTPFDDAGIETPDCDGPVPEVSHGYRNSLNNMYIGAQTAADETVVQFKHKADATHYVKRYRTAIDGCQAMLGLDDWRTTDTQRLHPAHSTRAYFWVVNENLLGFTAYRTISVVQDGGRVGILTMQSATSRPERTTDVPALMKDMAREIARS